VIKDLQERYIFHLILKLRHASLLLPFIHDVFLGILGHNPPAKSDPLYSENLNASIADLESRYYILGAVTLKNYVFCLVHNIVHNMASININELLDGM
jgi:hypothetical protein